MQKHTYAEFAINGVQNRNKIADINQFTLPKNVSDCYRSIFLFTEDIDFYVSRTKSVTGFAGSHIADSVVFDFDGDDLDDVRKEVINFCLHMTHTYELPIEYIRISFSGNKGFHVEIPFQCFSSNPQSSINFWRVYKEIAKDMCGGFRFIDMKIYESKRLFRIINTVNSKSNLYKIPLRYDEIEKLTQDEIKELAKLPRTLNYLPEDEIVPIEALEELYLKWKGYNFSSRGGSSQSESNSLFDGVSKGFRNDRAIRLTGILIERGLDMYASMEIIKMWNERNAPPLNDSEIEYLVRHAYEKYKTEDVQNVEIYSLKDAEDVYRNYANSVDGDKFTTGFPLIDKKIRGIVRGETCCILGKTSVGKSALLQQMGLKYAKNSKEPVLFFSLEMPITSVFERTVQIETGLGGVEVEKIYKDGDTDFSTRANLLFTEIPNFYTVTKSGLNLESIKNVVRYAEREVYHKKTGVILIDYLGLINEKGADIYQQISKIARGMKDLAKELNVPIVFLSQVNRNFSEYDELTLGAARDSGAIDEASDFILGLWKDENTPYRKEHPENILNLGIIKNRKGGTGQVKLKMEKRTLQMTEIE